MWSSPPRSLASSWPGGNKIPSLPFAFNRGNGIANGQSVAFLIPLPEIPLRVLVLEGIDLIRSTGALLTDGDHDLVGLSHRTDIQTANLLDDPDDFFSVTQGERLGRDFWWRGKSDFHGFINEPFHHHLEVAGPQMMVIHNATGATCAWSGNLWYSEVRVTLATWTLLKTRTSYESRR